MWIMTKVFLVPEAKPRDTKHTTVIIHIIYFMTNQILMAQDKAEGILHIKLFTYILQIAQK